MEPVCEFVASLPVRPKAWFLGGSRAKGTHRPDSDWDIYVLYEKESDVPYEWIFKNQDWEGLFPFRGERVDFHYFAEDWAVYQRNPSLLDVFKGRGGDAL